MVEESPDVNVSYFLLPYRDGIPPYKLGTKKQLQREMHRSVKINGQITLPHFPVSPTSLNSTSCLSVSFSFFFFFFCNPLKSNFYTLTRQLGPDSLEELCFIFFYFFQLMLCQNTIFHSPRSLSYKSRGK